jgi:hypothetical protein
MHEALGLIPITATKKQNKTKQKNRKEGKKGKEKKY